MTEPAPSPRRSLPRASPAVLRTVLLLWLLSPLLSAAVPPGAEALETAFQKAAEKAGPAVVNISSERVVERRFWPYDDDFFSDTYPSKTQSLGSGFIVSADGVIVTNQHVIAGASKITVKISEKTVLPAVLIGSDKKRDIAVLRVRSARPFPAVVLGDSDRVKVGQWAIAIGDPFTDLDRTVTVGVISGLGRKISGSRSGRKSPIDFIQTDASINPGNSGGPLCNLKGEVIGMNTAIYSTSGGSIGIGFAIPSNTLRVVIDGILQGEAAPEAQAGRPELRGMTLAALTPGKARELGFRPESRALVVDRVDPGSAAAQAGIEAGDLLLEINRVRVRTPAELKPVLEMLDDDEDVLVLIQRGQEGTYVVLRPGE